MEPGSIHIVSILIEVVLVGATLLGIILLTNHRAEGRRKADVAELKGDIAKLDKRFRKRLRAGLRAAEKSRDEIKSDITGLRTELKGDIASLKDDLEGDIRELRGDIKDLWLGRRMPPQAVVPPRASAEPPQPAGAQAPVPASDEATHDAAEPTAANDVVTESRAEPAGAGGVSRPVQASRDAPVAADSA